MAAAVLALATTLPPAAAVHVHDSVHRTLQQEGRVNVVLTMKDQRPDDILQPGDSTKVLEEAERAGHSSATGSDATPSPRVKTGKKACTDHDGEQRDNDTVDGDADSPTVDDGEQVQAMIDRLVQYTEEKHQEAMAVIKEDAADATTPESGKAKSLWISDEIYIRDATPELIEKLKQVPSLGSIREEVIARLSVQETAAASMDENDFVGEWGLERIQALDVWKLGYLGRNVRVGSIDSGVRGTHGALSGNFVGDYGWYDPLSKSTTPNDPADHGTGVMGVLAGGQGFGVAPKSQWMSCRACDETQRCRESNLLECAQFMTCPFLNGDKTKTDCSKKPHIINNSWNSERGVTVFENAINVWISAGIIPVFSNGNTGPGCGTVSAPADSTIGITVGATDYDDLLSGFSGRGPGLSGEIKPDLTAPGEFVVAPGAASDDNTNVFSGTSLAAPHVSGAIALLLEAFPGLTLTQVKSLLLQNTDTSVLSTTSQPTCGTLNAASVFPNNAFGYGRINILKAINAQKAIAAASSAAVSGDHSASAPGGSTAGSANASTTATSSSFNGTTSSSNSSAGPGTVNVGDL